MTDENQNKGQVVAGLIKQLGDNYLAEKKRADAATTEAETAKQEYRTLDRDYQTLATDMTKATATLNTVRGEKSQLEQLVNQKELALDEKNAIISDQAQQLAMYESLFASLETDLNSYLGKDNTQ